MESVSVFQSEQSQVDEEGSAANLIKYKTEIFNDEDTPSVGNPDADIVIVEFFDYNCGYCKKALPDVATLLEEDKNIRVVFKEMPILSPASSVAARWSLAADKQGKYWEFHKALMAHSGNKTEDTLAKIATEIGLDAKQLRKDASDPAINNILDRNKRLADALTVRGTPGFIIGDNIVRGYMGVDAMRNMIREIRAGQ